MTTSEITTIIVAIVNLTVFIVGFILNHKKTAAKIAAIGAEVEKIAPLVVQAVQQKTTL